ncbi:MULTISPECIES: ABC transporter permease [Curtobacterium]|uniref:ABC transporter permease n=1 Tax=Curtobacterium TaxID=2034 RepID=UPI0018E56009|nr:MULTISPECIES: ABC transporter permease [Curtobacterium]MCA5922065.1 ABC transporter permease [Curtobacterium oceanosedimentum]QQD75503.1 ABC transporter permease [Curtobacterium sp. YC1]
MSTLGTVVRFEFVRAVKKPAFWIGTLALPVVIVVVSLLVGIGQAAGTDSVVSGSSATKTPFHYVDESGLVSESVAARWGGSPSDDVAADRAAVRDGELDAVIVFPSSPSSTAIRIDAADRGLFANGVYSSLAERVLEQSVAASVDDAETVKLLRTPPDTDLTTYADGRVAPGWLSVVPPFLFVAAFFGLVVLLAARMVTVVVEEKENRISEMILTAVTAGDLIRGKVVAMLLVGLVQVGVFLLPGLVGLLVALPFIASRLGGVTVDPWRMVTGALLLVGGVLLASGLFVTVGAAVPSIKDASALQSAAIFALIIPLYAAFFVATSPSSPVAQFFTYFPTFTPVSAMVRNAVGALTVTESVICIVEVFVVAGLLLWFAEYLFRHSVAQYGSKVTVRQVLSWRRGRRG